MHASRRGRTGVTAGVCGLALASVAVLGAPAAHAADGPRGGVTGNYTGADVTGPSAEPLTAQAKEKIALTEAWYAAVEGHGDLASVQRRETAYLKKYKLTDNRTVQARSGGFAAMAAPTSRTLRLTHYGQAKNFYCGPATAAMMIKMKDGAIRSKYNRNAFSQANLANSAHMNTQNAGRTDWSSKRFVTGINRWRGEPYYVQVDRPSATLTTKAIRHAIGTNGMPVAADTVEFANGRHYNGHPVNKTIGHWITAYGYSNSGGTSKWADPSTTVWSSVNKTFSYNTGNFARYFLQSNGIAY
ncbi:C39 family peptidase [Streptomyces sp. NPDC048604]|uniref:C39 family peptidase n=1 Tax=Streptomyces sp. NPDC048604 TaxID=3365578 RepID=UPI003710FC11